jgi:HlyD family secretion protein
MSANRSTCVSPLSGVVLSIVVMALSAGCRSGDDGIRGIGTVELTEIGISPFVAARVTRMHVREGDQVQAGDTLITMERATMSAELEAKRAAVHSAEAALRDLQAGARPAEMDRLVAELRSLEADAVRAERDVERLEPQFRVGSASEQQLDFARTAARAARARVDATNESLRLLRDGARPQQIAVERANVEQARASLRATEASAGELVLLAPVAGVILARHAEPGEMLAPGESALTLADPTRPWVRIFLSQSAFPLISVGDVAIASLDAFPERTFRGRVVSLARRAEFTPRVALTENERADLLFGVRIEFDDASGMLKAGLPATVQIVPARADSHGDARDTTAWSP